MDVYWITAYVVMKEERIVTVIVCHHMQQHVHLMALLSQIGEISFVVRLPMHTRVLCTVAIFFSFYVL